MIPNHLTNSQKNELYLCHQQLIPSTVGHGKLKFNLHHLSSQNTPCLTVILRWQRRRQSMTTLKCEKQNRVGKSQAPQAEKETSSTTVQPCRGIHFLPVLSFSFPRTFSPVAFSQSLRYALSLFKILLLPPAFPRSALIFKCLCIYFQMNFLTLICFLLLLNRFSRGWYGAECDMWGILLSACFQSEQLYTARDTLISEKHKSISGRNTVSHLPFYSFPLSAHLKGLIVSLNMATLGLKENITFSEKTLTGWRRVKKLNRLYLFHMLCIKA